MSTKATLRLCSILIAAGLALAAAVERRARVRQTQENLALHQQLRQMEHLLPGNQRLSAIAGQADKAPVMQGEQLETDAGSNGQTAELIRLRNEVEALQQQYRELETLRADTAQARAALNQKKRNGGPAGNSGNADSSQFEILSANYWTANTNMDVAAELQDRVRGNRLRTVAGNNIKGDPEYGQTKNLTVVYRVGGVIRTNEFREGDIVVLPQEQSGSE